MVRRLVLVRHAKSAWDDPSLTDHERPLAPRGAKALRRLSEHLGQVAPQVDLVLCSTARRAVETLDGFRGGLPTETTVEVTDALYGAEAGDIVTMLRRLGSDVGCVVVVGHNPALQDLAVRLAAEGDAELRAQLARKLPTGSAVTISFEGDWADLAIGHLDALFMPRRPRP
jgi:phosphohistidine phosphatase